LYQFVKSFDRRFFDASHRAALVEDDKVKNSVFCFHNDILFKMNTVYFIVSKVYQSESMKKSLQACNAKRNKNYLLKAHFYQPFGKQNLFGFTIRPINIIISGNIFIHYFSECLPYPGAFLIDGRIGHIN